MKINNYIEAFILTTKPLNTEKHEVLYTTLLDEHYTDFINLFNNIKNKEVSDINYNESTETNDGFFEVIFESGGKEKYLFK